MRGLSARSFMRQSRAVFIPSKVDQYQSHSSIKSYSSSLGSSFQTDLPHLQASPVSEQQLLASRRKHTDCIQETETQTDCCPELALHRSIKSIFFKHLYQRTQTLAWCDEDNQIFCFKRTIKKSPKSILRGCDAR